MTVADFCEVIDQALKLLVKDIDRLQGMDYLAAAIPYDYGIFLIWDFW